MDRVERYRQLVSDIIRDYASCKPSNGKIDTEAIINPQTDHYEVMHIGWDGQRRVHGCVIHLDIIDGKIWIQYDGTNRPVADELMAAGVPKSDIIIGDHPPELWPITGFGVSSVPSEQPA